jgi:uncharacterized protein YdcH (DUF465 family)
MSLEPGVHLCYLEAANEFRSLEVIQPVSTPTAAIRTHLMANPEYQRLSEQHAHYAALLDQLTAKHYLSEQEQIEETRLKKLKLRLKDEMAMLAQKNGSA